MRFTEALLERAARVNVGRRWGEDDGANPTMKLWGRLKTPEELMEHVEREEKSQYEDDKFKMGILHHYWDMVVNGEGDTVRQLFNLTGMTDKEIMDFLMKMYNELAGRWSQHVDEDYKSEKTVSLPEEMCNA